MSIPAYQLSLSLSKDWSFGVLQRIPDGAQRTIRSSHLPELLTELAAGGSNEALHAWFDRVSLESGLG